MKQKPDLSFWKLWNLSFGFFGVQIAYALQSANISRIFRTLGADPHSLSFFWILPPLMGILVQPIVGTLSDRTWTRFGRRIPYLFIGALTAVAVMCLLPNAGSLGLSISMVMIFGLLMLMLLDTSINMAMQPFKMMVGDMVNEEQKGKAYSIQSFLCNAGSVVGFLFPFIFAWIGLKNVAPEGVVPDTVIWSFYIGAAILILCVIYTTLKVKEWSPEEYAEYNPVSNEKEDSGNLYMWTYVVDAVSITVWDTADSASEAYQVAGNWTGVLYAIQAMSSVAWAALIPRFKSIKLAYAVSMALGGLGFALIPFCPGQYLQIVPFLFIGCAWAAQLACPFTLVTNALQGYGHMGAYLGLFNGTICVPQIVAALLGGSILTLVGSNQAYMMIVSGLLLFAGACAVFNIKTKK